jgi:ABC-type dipeptide/oligopeptide/nickel transport system permease component
MGTAGGRPRQRPMSIPHTFVDSTARAILTRDYPLEQGIVLVIVVSIAAATLLLDLLYPVLDPRVRRSVA